MDFKNLFLITILAVSLNIFSAAASHDIEESLKGQLALAIEEKDTKQIKDILSRNPGLVNKKYNSENPLHEARNKEITDILLEYGADANKMFNGTTPIQDLIINWNDEYEEEDAIGKLQSLLEASADPLSLVEGSGDASGKSALALAKEADIQNAVDMIGKELEKRKRRQERIRLAQEELPEYLPKDVADVVVTRYLKK